MSSANQTLLADRIDGAVRNCLDQMGSEWLQGGDVPLTGQQDLRSERESSELSTSWFGFANNTSYGLDRSLAFRELGLDLPPQWYQAENELSGQPSNWPAQFEDDNVGTAPADTGGSLYGIENTSDCLAALCIPNGSTGRFDKAQWSSGDQYDSIVLD
jgi:hypothetical protein